MLMFKPLQRKDKMKAEHVAYEANALLDGAELNTLGNHCLRYWSISNLAIALQVDLIAGKGSSIPNRKSGRVADGAKRRAPPPQDSSPIKFE
jgi:hypothetical protein